MIHALYYNISAKVNVVLHMFPYCMYLRHLPKRNNNIGTYMCIIHSVYSTPPATRTGLLRIVFIVKRCSKVLYEFKFQFIFNVYTLL